MQNLSISITEYAAARWLAFISPLLPCPRDCSSICRQLCSANPISRPRGRRGWSRYFTELGSVSPHPPLAFEYGPLKNDNRCCVLNLLYCVGKNCKDLYSVVTIAVKILRELYETTDGDREVAVEIPFLSTIDALSVSRLCCY